MMHSVRALCAVLAFSFNAFAKSVMDWELNSRTRPAIILAQLYRVRAHK